jgi:hypothetical protein
MAEGRCCRGVEGRDGRLGAQHALSATRYDSGGAAALNATPAPAAADAVDRRRGPRGRAMVLGQV